MRTVLQAFIVLGLNFIQLLEATDQLIMAHAVFRHGDRAPVSEFTSEEARQYYYRGKGQLTNLGIKQAVDLGTELRRRTVDTGLLDKRMKPSQINFVSSGSPRCLQTASAVGSAMFDRTKEGLPVFVPVTMKPTDDDFFLYPTQCDRMIADMQQELGVNSSVTYYELIDVQGANASRSSRFFQTTEKQLLLEPLLLERPAGLAVPVWFNSTVEEEAKQLLFDGISYFSSTAAYHNPDRMAVKSGLLLAQIQNDFDKAIECINRAEECEVPKFNAYATHDLVLLPLLESLGVREAALGQNNSPPFTACLLFELHISNGEPVVKVFYRGLSSSFVPVTSALEFSIGLDECPATNFIKCCEKYKMDDPKAYCKMQTTSSSTSLLSFGVLFIFAVLLNLQQ